MRIGVDIGGTFTDIVALDGGGRVLTRKVSSTPADYARGIVAALGDLAREEGLEPAEVESVVHGTTVATNAILENRGARTGLLTTEGFRDVLEIRRLRMPELYNLLYEKPAPLVERSLRREVPERVGARGEVLRPLDEERLAGELAILLAAGIESVAVCFLNSYSNPEHEVRAGRIVARLAPGLSCSLSNDVLPEVREYERTSTTVINAYVRPIVERYLRSLLGGLEAIGVRAPVRIMQSNGGIMSARSAMLRPVHLVESGPAAGVVAARLVAARAGLPSVIAFDMGGTTAKASLIEEGRTRITSEFEVGSRLSAQGLNLAGGGYAMKIPVLDISEVGAGGGSVVWIDAGGSLQVGPRSAGADPGPACYGLGGSEPTVTDANVVLGYLNPRHLAGGSVRIEAERAHAALAQRVARPLGLGTSAAAWAAHVVCSARMIAGIKAVTTQRGRDPRESVLVAFGGNGPVHAAGMARLLGVRRVLVPPSPGLFSAFGLLFARHEHHVVRTFYRPMAELAPSELDAQVRTLEAEALAEMHADGYEPSRLRVARAADLRYVGQGFELTIPIEAGVLDAGKVARLLEDFRAEHLRTYGHRSEEGPVQLVNLRLTVLAGDEEQTRPGDPPGRAAPAASTRPVHFDGRDPVPCPVLERGGLAATPRPGPLIVEEYDATTVVPPGCTAALDGDGNIVLEIGEG